MWKNRVQASPSRSHSFLDLCRAIVLSREDSPRSFFLRSLLKAHPAGESCLLSIAASRRKITLFAIRICILTLPMNFHLHRERCDAVTLSLRSSLLKGLGSPFTESHAPCTTCWKPSTFVQKDWNWNLRPLCRLGANRKTKGQWLDGPEEIAERKASGNKSSHSTVETMMTHKCRGSQQSSRVV